jgi:hypothetical protein
MLSKQASASVGPLDIKHVCWWQWATFSSVRVTMAKI